MSMTDDSPIRNRLRSVSSLDDVVRLLKTSNRIMVLTGAGVSKFFNYKNLQSSLSYYNIYFSRSLFLVEYQIFEVITEFMLG